MIAEFRQDSDGRAMISYQQCLECSASWYFARHFCNRCGGRAVELKWCIAAGTLKAKSTLSRAPSKLLQQLTPYAIALIEIQGAFQVMTHCAADIPLGTSGVCHWSEFGQNRVLLFAG